MNMTLNLIMSIVQEIPKRVTSILILYIIRLVIGQTNYIDLVLYIYFRMDN